MDSKAPDSTMSPSKGESKRKKRRREAEQNSLDEVEIGGKGDITRKESELKGNMSSKASDSTMYPSKGESERKKRRREEEQNTCDEGKIGGKDDISRQESELKGNMDSKASDPTMSPSKGESQRKKRRREEEQNSFDEGEVGRKDDISREESEPKGNMENEASDPTMSTSKGESKRKKTRREEEQNGFHEVEIGDKDDTSRQDSELKGNIDSQSSNSTMSPSKGESKRKERRKEVQQNSFDEVEIGRKDDISRQESELKGNMDNKASEMSPSKGKSKRKKTVRFQEPDKGDAYENITYMPREKDIEDDVAFFSLGRNWYKDKANSDLHYGRFTKDEDEKIKNGVFNYIKMRGWDEKEGLGATLHSLQTDARGCWVEIARCLPYRPIKQIYTRAVRLLEDSKHGKWSAEELEALESLQNQYGNDWKRIGSYLGRSAQLCKDKWRHLKLLPTRKTGTWAQDEYDALCKLVRRSLRVKASIGAKTPDRREIRDDINWEWIEEKMQRDSMRCSEAWYKRLASPMINAKEWANGDDQLLLERLMELGAGSEEALDWDTILDHRNGDCCMARWKEMTRLLGKSDHVSFEDKLEILAKRYAPHLLGIEEEV